MKTIWKYGMVLGLMISVATVSQARVRVWIGINPFPVVVGPAPVVVAQPVAVADPYAVPPPDYRQVLADFHVRVQRTQRLLDRQLRRGIIGQRQYDRFGDELDAIVREEQQNAARHNGSLWPREVNELNRHLTDLQERIHEDLAR